mmetsp:Transcript_37633/g.108649  ORF Transcript_37633/g.108649 Transcript_37633/m.108649 type:complete len:223 (+) Transcript_37633:253-921(+)
MNPRGTPRRLWRQTQGMCVEQLPGALASSPHPPASPATRPLRGASCLWARVCTPPRWPPGFAAARPPAGGGKTTHSGDSCRATCARLVRRSSAASPTNREPLPAIGAARSPRPPPRAPAPRAEPCPGPPGRRLRRCPARTRRPGHRRPPAQQGHSPRLTSAAWAWRGTLPPARSPRPTRTYTRRTRRSAARREATALPLSWRRKSSRDRGPSLCWRRARPRR